MFVNECLFGFFVVFSFIGSITFLAIIYFNAIHPFVEKAIKNKELKEQRLLKIEEDIRYLKGIGGIENEN